MLTISFLCCLGRGRGRERTGREEELQFSCHTWLWARTTQRTCGLQSPRRAESREVTHSPGRSHATSKTWNRHCAVNSRAPMCGGLCRPQSPASHGNPRNPILWTRAAEAQRRTGEVMQAESMLAGPPPQHCPASH